MLAEAIAPDNSRELVERTLAGDRGGFEELHSRYSRAVHAILLYRVSPGEADDLVQDVFLQALERLADLRERDRFGPWICQIARNRATDFNRRDRHLELLPEELPQPHRPIAEAQQILRIIRTLPQTYSETLIMRLVEGMTGPEIAARTGLTSGSVRVNLSRGMKQLREKLGMEAT